MKNLKTTQVIIQSQFMALQIYRTRENRKFCTEKGIRMSVPPLGRPPKILIKNRRNKLNGMKDYGIILRVNSGKQKEDLV